MTTIPAPLLAEFRREAVITRIDILPLRYPTVMPFKFFNGPVSSGGRPAIAIRMETNDGMVGWGQSVPVPRWGGEPLESAWYTLEHYLKPVVLGQNPFDIEAIHAAMDRELPDAATTALAITKAGMDLALYDLAGRIADCNVAAFWGKPTGREVTLSWTVSPARPEEAPEWIAAGKARGYRHFNIKVAPDLDADRQLCRIVKEQVPDGFLWADANCGYAPDIALVAAQTLAGEGAAVLEQPLKPHCIQAYRQIKQVSRIPIVMDEGVVSPEQLAEYLDLGCCDGVAMKPARCGGLLSAQRQVALAQARGALFLGSGLTDPDMSLAASLILYGSHGLAYPAALNGPQFLGASLLKTPLTPVDGRLRAPEGPGLGVEMNEEALQEYLCTT